MVSFRFPFSFSQPPKPPIPSPSNASSRSFSATTIAAISFTAAAAGAGIAMSQNPDHTSVQHTLNLLVSGKGISFPMWGSLSLANNHPSVTESRTGMSFPAVVNDSQRLLGVGLRRKAVFGLKNVDVYAFGVYADDSEVQGVLSEKYGTLSAPELENGGLREDLLESDISMTVRLQIVYGRLSIKSVRSAFQDSVGSRLLKFGGSDNKELLQSFTSLFRDDIKIPKGSTIDLSREHGYVLRTTIDGKEVGRIQSKLLCRSVFDLYIGSEPFDQKAKEDVEHNLLSVLEK